MVYNQIKYRICEKIGEFLWLHMNHLEKKYGRENIKKKDLMIKTGISSATMNKLKHDQPVSVDIIDRLCLALNCRVEEILLFKKSEVSYE